ncbi:hypothetical protein ACWD25_31865 [Streptomyces sp. NPDC002920]
MANDTDVLLELLKMQREEARHTENQRATLTNIVILVTAAGLGFLAQQGSLRMSWLGVTLPMLGLGAFGAVACWKYGERWAGYTSLAVPLLEAIGQRHDSLDLQTLRRSGRDEHDMRFRHIIRVEVWWLWVALHAGISTGGLILSLWILVANP